MEKDGVIIFLKQNLGSKSEGVYPYLYSNIGECIRVFKDGDNPFTNDYFKPYDSKRVKIIGEMMDSYIEVNEILLLDSNENI